MDPLDFDYWDLYPSYDENAQILTFDYDYLAQDQQQIPLPMQPHMDPESIGLYDDAFAEGSHATPQSRKRNFDSTSLDVFGGDNKSRRTTPVRTNDAEDADAPWSSSHGSSKTIDYIDLTAWCVRPGMTKLRY